MTLASVALHHRLAPWLRLAASFWLLLAGCRGMATDETATPEGPGIDVTGPASPENARPSPDDAPPLAGEHAAASSPSSPTRSTPAPTGAPTPPIPAFPPARGARAPDIVLVTIDALRADRLPFYGAPRDTAPHLAALARQAVVFEHAFAHASETQASMPALFTGRFPPGGVWEEVPAGAGIAERLKAAGYRTGAFLGNAWLAPERGYGRGFDRRVAIDYVYPPEPAGSIKRPPARVDGATLVREALAFLEAADRPTFVWLHLMDVHNPYRPPPPHRGLFGTGAGQDRYVNGPLPAALLPEDLTFMRDRYDEAIHYTDALLKPLWQALEAKARAAKTLVVVTSDHGEEFGEHGGLGHGTSLHLEQLRIPLLLRLPGAEAAGTRVARTVALFDLAPTLLGAAGLPASGLDGHDLRGLLTPGGAAASRPGGPDDRLIPHGGRSLFDGQLELGALQGPDHLLFRPETGRRRLFRWLEDPLERHDLATRDEARSRALQAAVQTFFAARGTGDPPPPLATGQRAQLEALGYIGRP